MPTRFDELLFLIIQFLLQEPLVIIAIVIFGIVYHNKQYQKTSYFQITKNSYLSVWFDKGKYGEYLIYKSLQHYEEIGAKFLFNIYVPKDDGTTTEIDVLLISSKGLFVFESKNYTGWIFGNETQKNWTQVIYEYKNYFFNPIKQNNNHINQLRNHVDMNIPIKSVIVFSDRCTLKKITVKSPNTIVLRRCNLGYVIDQTYNKIPPETLTKSQINNIYEKLHPHTQVDSTVKISHMKNMVKK